MEKTAAWDLFSNILFQEGFSGFWKEPGSFID
jgi:hypothetical protein